MADAKNTTAAPEKPQFVDNAGLLTEYGKKVLEAMDDRIKGKPITELDQHDRHYAMRARMRDNKATWLRESASQAEKVWEDIAEQVLPDKPEPEEDEETDLENRVDTVESEIRKLYEMLAAKVNESAPSAAKSATSAPNGESGTDVPQDAEGGDNGE